MKLLLIGHARHGKTHAAQYIKDKLNLNFEDSSRFAAKHFIYDALKDKYGYKDFDECFEDRINHRDEWHNLICEYNKDDKTALCTAIFESGNFTYCGMRSYEEAIECIKKWPDLLVVWIFNKNKPHEPTSSFNIDPSIAHLILFNNGTLEEFEQKLDKLCWLLKPQIVNNSLQERAVYAKNKQ